MRTIEIGVRPVPFDLCKLLGRLFQPLYWSSLSNVKLRQVPEPDLLGPDWVKVRPILSGICASDLAGVTLKHRFDTFMSAFASFPIGLGHEVVGRVVDVGEAGRPSVDGCEGEARTAPALAGVLYGIPNRVWCVRRIGLNIVSYRGRDGEPR